MNEEDRGEKNKQKALPDLGVIKEVEEEVAMIEPESPKITHNLNSFESSK